MRERWAQGVAARAAAYWTPERTAALTSGKTPPLVPGQAAPLLRALGLLNADTSLRAGGARKLAQINHLVQLLEPAFLEAAARAAPAAVRILDAACGSSYLSFLLAWCFTERWRLPVAILGVDRNPRVVARCQARFAYAGLPPVARFHAAPLEGLDFAAVWQAAFGAAPAEARPHILTALHACDTASDEALALGVRLGADLLAVAPCCHAELARAWAELDARGAAGPFAPVWRSPHLRREVGAQVTDAMRAALLASLGYEVTALEFVPAEHTPKNTLLRAHRRGPPQATSDEYRALCAATGGSGIRLGVLVGR